MRKCSMDGGECALAGCASMGCMAAQGFVIHRMTQAEIEAEEIKAKAKGRALRKRRETTRG